MGEWVKAQLGELVEIGSSKRIFYKEYVADGIPFFRSKEVIEKSNRKQVSTELNISIERYKEIKDKFGAPVKGDMLLTSVGTLGVPWVVDEDEPFYFKDGNLTWFRNFSGSLSNTFLYYWLLSPNGKEQLDMVSIGSTQPALTIKGLKSLEINVPPTHDQKSIASILSSLDDKIDILHRQNKTLEAMAETIFRQWFVEEVQEGWLEGNLGSIADNPRNSIKPDAVNAETQYIGLEHIDRRNIALINSGSASEVTSNKYKFVENDILFGKLRPYFHKVCFAPYDGVCSTDILVIRPKRPEYFAYCLFAFYQNDVVEYANLGSGGTRMPRTNWETLSQYPIQVPDSGVLSEFNQFILPSINKIKKNIEQIQTLSHMRDALLPKLMSGEVRVAV